MIDFKSNLDVKTPKEIFAEINERFIGAVMMHGQFADYFDFLGLKGFKRMHEYHHIAESLERECYPGCVANGQTVKRWEKHKAESRRRWIC